MSVCGSGHEDDAETSCPVCDGDIPDHIVDRIMTSAAQQGPRMSVEDFHKWLADLDPSADRLP